MTGVDVGLGFRRRSPAFAALHALNRRLVSARIAATKAFLEQKFHLPVESVAKGGDTQGGVMTTLQAICLGAMLAWTPSLIVLALLLRDVPLDELDELQRDPS